MNVKQNNMRMSNSFPDDSQNSDSPYHLTANKLMMLKYFSDFEDNSEACRLHIPIEDNASSTYGSKRDIISPKGQDKIQGADFPWNENSLYFPLAQIILQSKE